MTSNDPNFHLHGMMNSGQMGPPSRNQNNIIRNHISEFLCRNNLQSYRMGSMMNSNPIGRGPHMGNHNRNTMPNGIRRGQNFHRGMGPRPLGMGPHPLMNFGPGGPSTFYQNSMISRRGVPHPSSSSGSRQQINSWPSLNGSQSTLRLETDDNNSDDGDNNDVRFSSDEEVESPYEHGPNSSTASMQQITSWPSQSGSQSTLSSSSGTTGLIAPPEMDKPNTISNGITDALHSRSQIQENQRQSGQINVPNPPMNNINSTNLLDMFKYYEKTFPKEFIQCLKLRCTHISCNICAVSFPINRKAKDNMIKAHYKGNRHSQSLKKHFQNWKKNKIQYIDNLLDLFKYYEKTYPQEFLYYLKLRCTSTSCNLCTVSFTGLVYGFGSSITSQNMVHYTGKRHVQTLRKYFINWKKSKQAQRPAKAKHIERTSPGSSLFTRLCTSGSGLNNRYNLICTKCAQRGHKKEDCPHNVVCGRCGLSGHFKKFCMRILAYGEDSDSDEIEFIVPPPKPTPQVVDLEENEADEMPPIVKEETVPDEMPTFEMDSAYIEDRINQEVIIEDPEKMRVAEALDTSGISFDHEEIILKQEVGIKEEQEIRPNLSVKAGPSKDNPDPSKVAEILHTDKNPTSSGINDIISKSGSHVKITTYRINEIKKMIKSYEKEYPKKFTSKYKCSAKACGICNIKFRDYTTERIFWHFKKSRHSEQVKKVFKKWTLKKDRSTKVRTETDELKEKCLKIQPVVKITKLTDDFVKRHIESAKQLTNVLHTKRSLKKDRFSKVRTETDELKEKCLKIQPVVKITKITDDFVKRHIESVEKYAMPSAEQLTKVLHTIRRRDLQMTEIDTNANESDSEAETEADESEINNKEMQLRLETDANDTDGSDNDNDVRFSSEEENNDDARFSSEKEEEAESPYECGAPECNHRGRFNSQQELEEHWESNMECAMAQF